MIVICLYCCGTHYVQTGHTTATTSNSTTANTTANSTSSTYSSLGNSSSTPSSAAEAQLSSENKQKTSVIPSSTRRRSSAKTSSSSSTLASSTNTLHTQSHLSLSGAIAAGRERVQSLTPTKVQQDKLQTLLQAQQHQLQQSGGVLSTAVALKAARASVVFKRASADAKDSKRMHDLTAAVGNHLPHTSDTHNFFR
jgi:hypothetical protein